MRTPKTLLCALMLSVMPAALGMMRPVATAGKTDLYGGIGRGSPLTPGALIIVDQDTGTGAFVGHPDSVPGLTGLVFDISGTLYGTTISGQLGTGRFSTLVRIDPRTGAQIGPALTITANDLPIPITDLALQPGTNTLYGTRLSEDDAVWATSPSHRCRRARMLARMADGRGSASLTTSRTRAIASNSLTQANSRWRRAGKQRAPD